MAINLVRCPVLGAQVTRVTDLEGHTTKVICSEYEDATGRCRVKMHVTDGGPLAQLLERTSEDSLHTRSARCDLAV